MSTEGDKAYHVQNNVACPQYLLSDFTCPTIETNVCVYKTLMLFFCFLKLINI